MEEREKRRSGEEERERSPTSLVTRAHVRAGEQGGEEREEILSRAERVRKREKTGRERRGEGGEVWETKRENGKKGRRGCGEMRRGMLLLIPLFATEKKFRERHRERTRVRERERKGDGEGREREGDRESEGEERRGEEINLEGERRI